MNAEHVFCPPGLKQWVIIKTQEHYRGGPGYSGPLCREAEIPAQQVYFSKKSALEDCHRLNNCKPKRFVVTEYHRGTMNKQDFLNKLSEYHERWKDQRQAYIAGFMGHAAINGVQDFLNFVAPDKFQAKTTKHDGSVVVDTKASEPIVEKKPTGEIDVDKEHKKGRISLITDNIVSLKGKGTIFIVTPTSKHPKDVLMGLAGQEVYINKALYRVINAETTSKPKGDVGLVVQAIPKPYPSTKA